MGDHDDYIENKPHMDRLQRVALLHLMPPTFNTLFPLVEMLMDYYETVKDETAYLEWEQLKTWTREHDYTDRDMNRAREIALMERDKRRENR